jgi:hypothetical protein
MDTQENWKKQYEARETIRIEAEEKARAEYRAKYAEMFAEWQAENDALDAKNSAVNN